MQYLLVISKVLFVFHQNIDLPHIRFQQVLHQLAIARFLIVIIYNQSRFQQVLHQLASLPFLVVLIYSQLMLIRII